MDSLSIYTFLCIARAPKYECFCSDEIKMKMKPRLQRVSAVWVVVVEAPVRRCWRHAGQGVRGGGDGRFSAFKTWGEIGTKYARYQSQPAFGHYMPETPQKPLGKFHKIYCDFPLNCISLALAALFFLWKRFHISLPGNSYQRKHCSDFFPTGTTLKGWIGITIIHLTSENHVVEARN